jgi:hypothetical protein
MNLYIIISLLIFQFTPVKNNNKSLNSRSKITIPQLNNKLSSEYGIDNGWYVATVKYHNFNSGTFSRYRLKVKVEYDRVTAIDFGNGGSVHSGYNSSGYFYSGGYLSFDKDYNGEITSASAKVKIIEANSNLITFDITIE